MSENDLLQRVDRLTRELDLLLKKNRRSGLLLLLFGLIGSASWIWILYPREVSRFRRVEAESIVVGNVTGSGGISLIAGKSSSQIRLWADPRDTDCTLDAWPGHSELILHEEAEGRYACVNPSKLDLTGRHRRAEITLVETGSRLSLDDFERRNSFTIDLAESHVTGYLSTRDKVLWKAP